jgi:acyl-CoA reductase-like NAD-dependent aldehyde dehydrogenase
LREWKPEGERKPIECVNPSNLEKLSSPLPAMNKEDVFQRIRVAKEEQKEWMKTSFTERKRVLNHLLQNVLKYKREIVKASCDETGKTCEYTVYMEIYEISVGRLFG